MLTLTRDNPVSRPLVLATGETYSETVTLSDASGGNLAAARLYVRHATLGTRIVNGDVAPIVSAAARTVTLALAAEDTLDPGELEVWIECDDAAGSSRRFPGIGYLPFRLNGEERVDEKALLTSASQAATEAWADTEAALTACDPAAPQTLAGGTANIAALPGLVTDAETAATTATTKAAEASTDADAAAQSALAAGAFTHVFAPAATYFDAAKEAQLRAFFQDVRLTGTPAPGDKYWPVVRRAFGGTPTWQVDIYRGDISGATATAVAQFTTTVDPEVTNAVTEHALTTITEGVGGTIRVRWEAITTATAIASGDEMILAPEVWSATNPAPINNKTRLASLEAKTITSYTEAEILLPDTLYAVVGEEMNVYFASCIHTNRPLGGDLYVEVASTCGGTHNEEGWRFTPTSGYGGTTQTLTLTVMDGETVLATRTVSIYVSATSRGTGVTRGVLSLGDSTTESASWITAAYNKFFSDVMAVKWLGTRLPNDAGTWRGYWSAATAYSVGDVVTHQIGAYSQVYQCAQAHTNQAPTGATSAYWTLVETVHEAKSGKTVDWHYTHADSRLVNAGAYSFTYYRNNHVFGFTSGDWVLIHLGINDVFPFTSDADVEAAVATMVTQLDAMILANRVSIAGIRHALVITIPPCASQDGFGASYDSGQSLRRYERNWRVWVREMLSYYDTAGQQAISVFVVGAHAAIDRARGFPTTTAAASAATAETATRQTNGVHPNSSGYTQMGEAIRAFLKGKA